MRQTKEQFFAAIREGLHRRKRMKQAKERKANAEYYSYRIQTAEKRRRRQRV